MIHMLSPYVNLTWWDCIDARITKRWVKQRTSLHGQSILHNHQAQRGCVKDIEMPFKKFEKKMKTCQVSCTLKERPCSRVASPTTNYLPLAQKTEPRGSVPWATNPPACRDRWPSCPLQKFKSRVPQSKQHAQSPQQEQCAWWQSACYMYAKGVLNISCQLLAPAMQRCRAISVKQLWNPLTVSISTTSWGNRLYTCTTASRDLE